MTLFYVDVSHYDFSRKGGNLDWAAMKQHEGIDIMIARATYGDPAVYNPETRHFKEMVTGAKAAGFSLTGGYHNLIHGDDHSIVRQVDYFRKELDNAGADWAMLDVEPYEALKLNGLWPRLDDAKRFADRFRFMEPNRILTHYISKWVWEGWLGRGDLVQLNGPLIAARYSMGTKQGTPTELYNQSGADGGAGWLPYGNAVPSMWQFTSNGIVTGASGTTDVNAYKGTKEQFKAAVLRTPVPTPPPPVPVPEPKLPVHKNGVRTLKVKSPLMRGTDVRFVQKFIGEARTGPADGVYGDGTKAGVIWYQGIRGLKKDGEVGPKTWASLLSK